MERKTANNNNYYLSFTLSRKVGLLWWYLTWNQGKLCLWLFPGLPELSWLVPETLSWEWPAIRPRHRSRCTQRLWPHFLVFKIFFLSFFFFFELVKLDQILKSMHTFNRVMHQFISFPPKSCGTVSDNSRSFHLGRIYLPGTQKSGALLGHKACSRRNGMSWCCSAL